MNPTVTQDLSIISLIANASVLVQLVMAALLLASFFSWYYIFLKRFTLKRVSRQADDFDLYTDTTGTVIVAAIHKNERRPATPVARIEVGAVHVSKDGEDICGDAWSSRVREGRVTMLVADG